MKYLILGGAGFIGSNIAKFLINEKHKIIVVDGLLPKTSGRYENLDPILSCVQFINKKVEEVNNLNSLLDLSDIVIDCMAWTSHRLALIDPFYDLELNEKSHLALIKQVPKNSNKKFIFLGSRSQYGNPNTEVINEETPMIPEDIQGIHKFAAESYYKVYSNLNNMNVVSLRFANCFGRNQPMTGPDIGLIGSFIKDALTGKNIEIYGESRRRNIIYVDDLAWLIVEITKKNLTGFNAYNVSGINVLIKELAEEIVSIVGKGSISVKKMPKEIETIDMGDAEFSDEKIRELIGEIPKTGLKESISETINYFKEYIS